MKKLKKNRFWFTLVELIVVITILAILWTIAFISLQWYSKSARDSVRISDVENIVTSLTLYEVQKWAFPVPSDNVEVTYLGWEVWTQWTIGDSVLTNLAQISNKIVDPSSGSEYTYSRLNTKKEYQVAAVFEWWLAFESDNNILSSAHAAWNVAWTAYVKWNYNGMLAKVSTWWTLYTLAVPTLISWDITVTSLTALQAANKLVYKGTANLPASYESSNFRVEGGGFVFNPSDIVVYTWSMNTLSDITNRVQLVESLQNVYDGTDLATLNPDIQTLVDTIINPGYASAEAELLSSNIIKNSINPSINVSIASEATFRCDGGDYNTAYNNYWWYYSAYTMPNTGAFAALKSDGTIFAWWDSSKWWTWAPVDDWYKKIASSAESFAALKDDGSITVWWNGGAGSWALAPSESWFIKISSTSNSFAALKEDGTIFVWWLPWASAGDQAEAPTGSDYKNIYAANYTFSALNNDGTVYSWWSYVTNGPVAGVWYTSISSSSSAFAWLKSDGTIFAWWDGGYWWIWNVTWTWYVSISSTTRAFAALKDDGSIFTWWDGSYWWTWSTSWAISGTWYTKIFSTQWAFAALKDDGSITAWWTSGWWWDNTEVPSWTWYINIYSNSSAFAALHGDNETIYGWGFASTGGVWAVAGSWYTNVYAAHYWFAALKPDGTIKVWWNMDSNKPSESETWFTKIMSTEKAFVAMKSDGSIYAWWNSADGGDNNDAPNDIWYVSINWVCNQ